MARLPLEGIRVADFSWIINGPQITLWLAAMGADVIRVESQVYLDTLRNVPTGMPPGIQPPNGSGSFHYLNYGKKGITINLRTDKGKQLAYELVRRSDIAIECYPRPLAERLGLGYDKLKSVKDDIILISVSLLGRSGLEQIDWTGWGPMAAAFVGMCSAQGYRGGAPRQTGGTWPDYSIGYAVVFHALAALWSKRRTGKGQWIDASMGDTVLGEMPELYMDYFMNGRGNPQRENHDDVMAPHNTYPCSGDDKWIAIAVADDSQWQALCQAMGSPAWTAEDRFSDQFERHKNREELDRLIGEWTMSHDHIELAHLLQNAGVPAGPVLDCVEVTQDRHLWEWGYWWKANHHLVGERLMYGIPVKMSKVPEYNRSLAPDVGQHNKQVFCGLLGLSEDEVRTLMDQQIIY